MVAAIAPVSYTHLDVYKRQAQSLETRPAHLRQLRGDAEGHGWPEIGRAHV